MDLVGLFDEKSSPQTFNAFRYAVQSANAGNRGGWLSNARYVPRIVSFFRADLITGPEKSILIVFADSFAEP